MSGFEYKLTGENSVIRLPLDDHPEMRIPLVETTLRSALDDNGDFVMATVPNENPDYLEYKAFLENGGVPLPAPVVAEDEAERLTAVLNAHLDATAGQRRYDNRFTCALRAANPDSPFHAEGMAFSTWMDECNFTAYQIMAQCRAGQRAIPTDAELIAALPVLTWPPSPIPDGAV